MATTLVAVAPVDQAAGRGDVAALPGSNRAWLEATRSGCVVLASDGRARVALD